MVRFRRIRANGRKLSVPCIAGAVKITQTDKEENLKKLFKKLLYPIMTLTMIVSLIFPTVVLADGLTGDADILNAGNSWNVGNVLSGTTISDPNADLVFHVPVV